MYVIVLQAYVHQMAACLAHLTQAPLSEPEQTDRPAMQRLRELLAESGSLIVITLESNLQGFKDLQNCNFEEGVVCPDAQPPSFYCEVMVGHCDAATVSTDAAHIIRQESVRPSVYRVF